VYLEGTKSGSFSKMLYNVFFISRRFISAVFLVFMLYLPYIQCVVLMTLSFVSLCFLVVSKPLQKDNKYEVFNEVFIYLCTLIMTNMVDSNTSMTINNLRGWMLIVMASFNILVNITITALSSILDIVRSNQEKNYKKKSKENLEK
jgi:hypothetical protein